MKQAYYIKQSDCDMVVLESGDREKEFSYCLVKGGQEVTGVLEAEQYLERLREMSDWRQSISFEDIFKPGTKILAKHPMKTTTMEALYGINAPGADTYVMRYKDFVVAIWQDFSVMVQSGYTFSIYVPFFKKMDPEKSFMEEDIEQIFESDAQVLYKTAGEALQKAFDFCEAYRKGRAWPEMPCERL